VIQHTDVENLTNTQEGQKQEEALASKAVPQAHEEGLEYGDNAADIAADNMAATFAAHTALEVDGMLQLMQEGKILMNRYSFTLTVPSIDLIDCIHPDCSLSIPDCLLQTASIGIPKARYLHYE